MLFINAFVAQPFRIPPTGSMRPTIQDNDYVIANKAIYNVQSISRGDIVVIRTTKEQELKAQNSKHIIKRVVALPGDTIDTREGQVYINGEPAKEPYLSDTVFTLVENKETGELEDMKPFQVPKGQYFVMGDNRGHSTDSRYLGTMQKSQIVGRADLCVWPFSRIGGI